MTLLIINRVLELSRCIRHHSTALHNSRHLTTEEQSSAPSPSDGSALHNIAAPNALVNLKTKIKEKEETHRLRPSGNSNNRNTLRPKR